MLEKFYGLSMHSTEELISHVENYVLHTLDLPVKKTCVNTRTIHEIRTFGFRSGIPSFINGTLFCPVAMLIHVAFDTEGERVKVSLNYSGLGLSMIGNIVEGFKAARIMKDITAEIDSYMS